MAQRHVDSALEEVPVEAVAPGDVVLVRTGEVKACERSSSAIGGARRVALDEIGVLVCLLAGRERRQDESGAEAAPAVSVPTRGAAAGKLRMRADRSAPRFKR